MAKASSQFQSVIRVKKHQEKLTQQQLMLLEDVHSKEKKTLDHLHEVREEAVGGSPQIGKARANDLQTRSAFIFKLTRQIDHQSSKVDEIGEKTNAKREELTKRAQSRQMVEKLDQKRKEEASKKNDRREQEMMDDVANRSNKNSVV